MLSAAVDLGAVDATFSQWEADARSGTAEVRKAMMLEIDGWLRRLAPDLAESAAVPDRSRVTASPRSTAVGSVSQFYDRLTSSCGTTPRPLRLDMRS